ncbi:MAG: hypothetical protein FJX59_06270 [Alphaproteobacteria bacterium]|nr:hypothetical protein [Alphaproteobacteria bacterium]
MIRTLLQYGIPFLLPLAGYAAWVWYRNAYADRHEGALPKFEEGPWPAMLLLGAVLMAASMAYTALTSGASSDATYVPPRVEDGKVIPGQFIEPGEPK